MSKNTMKNKTMSTTIGTINLSEAEFAEDIIEIFIPIIAVSENLKTTIEEQLEEAKEKFQKEILDCKGMKWSDSGSDITYQWLDVTVKDHKISYELCFQVTDKENEIIETDFSIAVDLSEYAEEIKKLFMKAIINKFF